MAGNDTAALVVALSAQLTKFEKNMADAVGIADKTTKQIGDKFASANGPLVAGLTKTAQGIGSALQGIGSSFLGSAGIAGLGLSALLATAIKLNGELSKIPGLARLAGISTDRLQEIKFAGALKGVGDDAFTTSLDASVRLLDEAQRQVNTLSRLFNANGISIKNQNGELIKFDDLLEIAAKLMANTKSEQEKIKVAEMLGLSREWVAVLRNGPEEFRKAAQSAHDAGAVIDREILNKAKEFDRQWNAAVVKFKAGFVSGLTDLTAAFKDFWESLVDSVPGASFIRDKLQQWAGGLDRLTLPELEAALARSIEQGVGQFEIDRIQAAIDKKLGNKTITLPVVPVVSDDSTVIPKDKQKNAFDSAVFETNKRIAATDAETRSVGLNTDAHERAKVVAALEEAAKKANTDAGFQSATITDLQREKINQLADAMQAATKRQAESHAELFRFAVDGQNFVKQFDAAAIAAFGSVENGLVALINGTQTAKEAFRGMATSILSDLAKMIIRMSITAPLARALAGSLSSIGGGGGFFGGSPESNANLVPTSHSGRGPGDPFGELRRLHSGIGPNEMPAIIRRDEFVLTPGQMRGLAPANRSGEVQVHLHGSGADKASVSETSDGRGGRRIDIVLDETVAGSIARGRKTRSALRNSGQMSLG